MSDTSTFQGNLESSIRRQFVFLGALCYVVTCLLLFVAISWTFTKYFEGLVRAQNYSLAVQEWRATTNGILDGWSIQPSISDICVVNNSSNVIFSLGECPVFEDSLIDFRGRHLFVKLDNYSIRAKLKFSIWILALILPFIIFATAAFLFALFRGTIVSAIQLQILEFIASYDKNRERASEFESALQRQTWELVKLREEAATSNIAAQVAHDIRSPLSALNMGISSLCDIPEEKRLMLRSATQRINDIANGLLEKGRSSNSLTATGNDDQFSIKHSEPIMLVAMLDSIVSEKRLQYRNRMDLEIHGQLEKGYGLFAKVSAIEFARVLSNLINNSVEALLSGGRIIIAISMEHDMVAVSVTDDAGGMPPEVLAQVGARGFSFGKKGIQSSGLGLYHARKTLQNAGGELRIESTSGIGTAVTLTLPRAITPAWFVEKLTVSEHSKIVSIDDDHTIHQIWSGRFSSLGIPGQEIEHSKLTTTKQLHNSTVDDLVNTSLFLVDYEFLGQSENGLDAIEKAGIADRSILVTSRYEEPHVRARAEKLGVRMLPKSLAQFVPIEIRPDQIKVDAILIDDDPLIHMTWQMAASEIHKTIRCFTSKDAFWREAHQFALESRVYIDVNLGNEVRGDQVASEIARIGFSEIYLATGFDATSITKPDCVRGIVGKDPIF